MHNANKSRLPMRLSCPCHKLKDNVQGKQWLRFERYDTSQMLLANGGTLIKVQQRIDQSIYVKRMMLNTLLPINFISTLRPMNYMQVRRAQVFPLSSYRLTCPYIVNIPQHVSIHPSLDVCVSIPQMIYIHLHLN